MIRRIKEADIPSAIEMMLANWDQVVSSYHSPEVVKNFRGEVTPDWLKRQMAWKQIFVMEKEGEIIATGGLADFGQPDAPRPSVSQFFVQPHLHRQGIGERLMEHIIQVARNQGCSQLHVPSNRFAIPFYSAMGFSLDTAQPNQAEEITWMTLDLKSSAE